MTNIVWKTQDEGVHLGAPERKANLFPGADKDYITIKMKFDKGVGITWDDYYLLYIDPDTYLLKGCLINQTYAAILRPGMDAMQQHFVIKNYKDMAGLKMPGEFTTYFANYAKLADGKFYNWQANVEFDESRLEMPEGGLLDTSKPRRVGTN
ncbi:MAG: hypothetical protein ACE5DO_14630 [Desulfobacterales bacterium]